MNQKRNKPFARVLFISGILIGIVIGVWVSKLLFEPIKLDTQKEHESTETVKTKSLPLKQRLSNSQEVSSSSVDELPIDEETIDSLWVDSTMRDYGMDTVDYVWDWQDTITIDPEFQEEYDYEESENEMALAKDILIAVKLILPLGDRNNFSCDSNDDLDSLLVDYNTTPKDDLLRVEFWRSPLNNKGFILTRNKLVLYGLYQLNEISIEYMSDGRLLLTYLEESFVLRCTDKFIPFDV